MKFIPYTPRPFRKKGGGAGGGVVKQSISLFNNPTPNLSTLRRGEELEEKLN